MTILVLLLLSFPLCFAQSTDTFTPSSASYYTRNNINNNINNNNNNFNNFNNDFNSFNNDNNNNNNSHDELSMCGWSHPFDLTSAMNNNIDEVIGCAMQAMPMGKNTIK